MSVQDITKLICHYKYRLQKLKEQQASFGLNTPAHILIEIEDIEAGIKELQTELETLEDSDANEESPAELVEDDKLRRVQIYMSGEYISLSAERRSLTVEALAALLGIPSSEIEVYRVSNG